MTSTTSRTVPAGSTGIHPLLGDLGLQDHPKILPASTAPGVGVIHSYNPATGQATAAVKLQTKADYEKAVTRAEAAQLQWRMLPAPKRGEVVRLLGNAFREHIGALGDLITLEAGKIRAEGKGEVQECIDIADFAVGLSRQLYGLTIHSERAKHRMYEQWHPLGTVGIITAFNFPIAVWAWNAMLAAVCGNASLWKPSLITPLTAIATTHVVHEVMREQTVFRPAGIDPRDLFPLVIGTDAEIGEALIADRRIGLISATGSCRMGRHVGQVVAGRLGRTLLELGGNNAIIVMPDADLKLAARGILFGAVGTAGQRCTTTRRLICHSSVVEAMTERLVAAYRTVPIGDPADAGTLMGPLINKQAVAGMRSAIERATKEGCTVLCGGIPGIERQAGRGGHFVEPTIVRVPKKLTANGGTGPAVAREETFAPILYIFEVDSLEQAIALQNSVDQGLSSAIFTDSVRNAEWFLSHAGSDCGIANVNIGTSGAEIGGAFGGEKDTGGGRESGSDSWKAYMRRQTCTINFGTDLPLAQGITFGE